MLLYTCFLLFMLSVTLKETSQKVLQEKASVFRLNEVLRVFNTQTGLCMLQDQSGILEDVDTTLHTQPITLICIEEYSLGCLILHKTTV